MRQVRQGHEDRRTLLFDLIQLDAQLSNLLRALTVRLENGAGVLALSLCASNFVAGRVLFAFHSFELGNQPPPPVLERGQLFELAVGVHSAALQAAFHFILVVAYVSGIKHCEIVCQRATGYRLLATS